MDNLKLKSIFYMAVERIIACTLSLFLCFCLDRYIGILCERKIVLVILICSSIWPHIVFQIIEMLIYWAGASAVCYFLFGITDYLELFLICLAVTTILKSISILKLIIDSIKFIFRKIFAIPSLIFRKQANRNN